MVRMLLAETTPVALEQLHAHWADLNTKYFDGILQTIRIEWSARLTSSAGMFVIRIGGGGREDNRPRRLIRLSTPLLQHRSEQELLSTLAHEMIHQWQFDVRRRRPDHGDDFLDKMAVMNADGLRITIHHALDEEVGAFMTYAWRCLDCGQDYRRQRRTIRPRDHRCGACHGPLGEVLPGKLLRKRRPVRPLHRSAQYRPPPFVQLELPFPNS
ncbi:MAG: SprT family zinc-dependent metalloprotease [Nitrospira sp.]|nr:SprT family zinc-dependent metalloprotease [Nitrospira sp.]